MKYAKGWPIVVMTKSRQTPSQDAMVGNMTPWTKRAMRPLMDMMMPTCLVERPRPPVKAMEDFVRRNTLEPGRKRLSWKKIGMRWSYVMAW